MNSQQWKFIVIFTIFELTIFFINYFIITDVFERTSDLDQKIITLASSAWGIMSSIVPAFSAFIIIHYIHIQEETPKQKIKNLLVFIVPFYFIMLAGEIVLFYDLVYEDTGGLYSTGGGIDTKASVLAIVFGVGHYLMTAFILYFFYHEVWGYISSMKIKGKKVADEKIKEAENATTNEKTQEVKNDNVR